jgi:hypothetical protein
MAESASFTSSIHRPSWPARLIGGQFAFRLDGFWLILDYTINHSQLPIVWVYGPYKHCADAGGWRFLEASVELADDFV